MTKKLYYDDAYITRFETSITRQGQEEDGRPFIVLEETAFYPTGGGQPFDEGTLNGTPVTDVEEVDGEIRHYLETRIAGRAETVTGKIDWTRRFDHMQQHAGQHILSAAFAEALDYETVSFHLGKDILTIDLAVERMKWEDAQKAEELANEVIRKARPIETKWMTAEEAAAYPLRKDLAVSDQVRLVIIPDFDYNGCGGTHPRSTSEVGAIKILDWEKHKGHIRLQFVCGDRVLRQLHEKNEVLKELTSVLQSPQDKMKDAASQLIAKAKDQEKQIAELKQELLKDEAKELQGMAMPLANGATFIKGAYQNRPVQELQQLAREIVADTEEAVVFFAVHNADKLQVVGAKGKKADQNLKTLAPAIFALVNGKGGGREDFIQGGGEPVISPQALLDKVENMLIEQITN
ncbi:DHHA1 domain-containing protein [Rossellomorea aquimaris]|uniref:alanyl-tRNA editing protein n=1 Tax=Rossellomorea aquimaris TaxID=189382 RepID=UPI001CD3C652|nr:DHHA1 domain-containing protein [Rossellomorea aquimaris]MCA1056993.1 DHHA1 domain-containing protein [Rossellomorea aquimaris]